MKRAIRIIMAAGMAALAVTGCGGGSTTQTTSPQTTAAGAETTVGETSAPAENKEAQVISPCPMTRPSSPSGTGM